MGMNISAQAVTIGLDQLKTSKIDFKLLEDAFGPDSLGILIVKDLSPEFRSLRRQVLSSASYLANLSPEKLQALECPKANYLTGWSHGKEALQPGGQLDILKGSFYVNCAFYKADASDLAMTPHPLSRKFPDLTAPNLWPADDVLPGFRNAVQDLCRLIIDTGVLVAQSCDRYAEQKIEDYHPGYLEQIVRSSTTTKARLLHYFPPQDTSPLRVTVDEPAYNGNSDTENDDSWCATHVDHGCLTGLTSAMYIDELAHPPYIAPTSMTDNAGKPGLLPSTSAPSPLAGLYIQSRTGEVVKVNIPEDCLAFQTGEALELITRGRFRAVPHFVRSGANYADRAASVRSRRIARNTLAVFMQPDLGEVVDSVSKKTFGDFTREVVERFKN